MKGNSTLSPRFAGPAESKQQTTKKVKEDAVMMKKINIALMVLSGLAVIGLTGCGGGGDDKKPIVENVTTPAPATSNNGTSATKTPNTNSQPATPSTPDKPKFSSIAGTYTGKITGTGCGDQSVNVDATLVIAPGDATTTLNLNSTDMPSSANNLTSSSFNYKLGPDMHVDLFWGDGGKTSCGNAAAISGTCQYKGSSLKCSYSISGTAASGSMNLSKH